MCVSISVYGYLCHLHVLAIVNNTVMYIFEVWFSLDIGPGVGLLDHMVALLLVF